jgi:putative transposase
MDFRKTYKFKAKLSKTTEQNAVRWLGLCQQLYNLALEQRIVAYKRCGISLSTYSQSNELPEFKKAFPEFKGVNSQTLQDTIERLGKAFQGFFSRLNKSDTKAGFPRFRSYHRYDSFTLKTSGWRLEGRHLKIKGLGTFKLFLSQPIVGKIKTITVRRDGCGDWWVSFSCAGVPAKAYPHPETEVVGIDVGLSHFCTDTDGLHVANPKYYRKAQAELRRKQRQVARRKKGSNRRQKAVKELARVHRKVARMRLDFLHKTANHYISNYQTICVEALQVKHMVKNRHLSKSIADSGWCTFFELLLYKAAEAGRELIQVNPRNTSQNCSGCGAKVPKALATRVHRCPHCNLSLDRDINAARNIAATGSGQLLQALT